MKNFRGVIILLGLIMACLIVLSVFLTIQLIQKTREKSNPADTSASTIEVSETDNGQGSTQPTGTSVTASTMPTTSITIETTPAETTAPTSPPATTEPAATTASSNLPGLITPGQAESVALAQFEGDAQILEIENHTGDNPPHYEIELTDGNYEYSLKIHAVTGAIIDFEKEPVGETEDGEADGTDG